MEAGRTSWRSDRIALFPPALGDHSWVSKQGAQLKDTEAAQERAGAGDGETLRSSHVETSRAPGRTKGPKEQMFLESEMMVKLGCNSIYEKVHLLELGSLFPFP